MNSQQIEQSDKHFWHNLETSAPPEAIWKIWTDVPQWKNWDTGLKDATLQGIFRLNTKGKIISLKGRSSKFKIIEFKEGESYTFKTQLPLGGLYVKRFLQMKNGRTCFTHEVWFKGLSSRLFAKNFGAVFREMLPETMHNIKEIAEQ
ncbi:SRPBCC family protein [Costertonia aggregata]|nr:SRPBCC family protein [Costertonia aggregata]